MKPLYNRALNDNNQPVGKGVEFSTYRQQTGRLRLLHE